jgi:hypothetical protein
MRDRLGKFQPVNILSQALGRVYQFGAYASVLRYIVHQKKYCRMNQVSIKLP